MASIRLYKEELEDPENLPAVCMKCGAEATTRVRRSFAWTPPWTIVIIIAGLLPYLIVALVLRKSMRVYCPMCDAHAGHWRTRALVTWLGLALVVLLPIGYFAAGPALHLNKNQEDVFFVIGGFIALALFLGWAILASTLSMTSIRPSEITNTDITLVRVAPEFREAVNSASEATAVQALPQALPAGVQTAAATGTKACPYCAETIKATAVKCRFCGEFLDDE